MRKINKIIYMVSCMVVIMFSIFSNVFAISQESIENYRIRVYTHSNTARIKANSAYSIYADNQKIDYGVLDGEEFILLKNNDNVNVYTSANRLLATAKSIDFKRIDQSNMSIVGVKNGSSYIEYPDDLNVKMDKSGTLQVVNITNIETYLKGVLVKEMGASAPLEALKAQATTARTLAVNRAGKYESEGYDVRNDTSDQVYSGYTKKYFEPSSNIYKAVEETKGAVIKYGDKLASTVFYDNNGGFTANDGFVWSSGYSTPYYTSKADAYDTYLHPSVINWNKLNYSVTYTKDQLYNQIINASKSYPAYFSGKYCVPAFNGLSPNFTVEVKESINGYVTKSIIRDDTGRMYTINNYANRWVYGLRSQKFTLNQEAVVTIKNSLFKLPQKYVYVKNSNGKNIRVRASELYIKTANSISFADNTTFEFKGSGYGHGVGMSQNGAMNRADAGHNYIDILTFYYDGCNISLNYGQ